MKRRRPFGEKPAAFYPKARLLFRKAGGLSEFAARAFFKSWRAFGIVFSKFFFHQNPKSPPEGRLFIQYGKNVLFNHNLFNAGLWTCGEADEVDALGHAADVDLLWLFRCLYCAILVQCNWLSIRWYECWYALFHFTNDMFFWYYSITQSSILHWCSLVSGS